MSLTSKFLITGTFILIFIASFAYTNFRHTGSTKDSASKINYAGTLRFRVAEIAWLISRLKQHPEHPDRELLEEEVLYEISSIDQIIDTLQNGSSERGISPVPPGKTLTVLHEISAEWNSRIKPFFMARLNDREPPDSLTIPDLELHSFVEADINSFVYLLENEYLGKMNTFVNYNYYLISFFIASFLVILLFVRKDIIRPILKLKNATFELGENFNADLRINNRDEIGDLANSFKKMEERLEESFNSLRISERKTRHIMEVLPTGIAVSTPEGKVLESNNAICDILGYASKEEFEGLPAVSHYHDPKERERLIGLVKRNEAKNVELRLRHRNGNVIWASVSSVMETTAAGDARIINAVSDITAYKQAKEHTERNYELQSALNGILALSLKDTPLNDILNKVLKIILSITWLSSRHRGAIFLKNTASGALEMKAASGIGESVMQACGTLTPGKCICGRAASSRTIQFVDSLDKRHEITYDGISPHGHYCVPILIKGETAGVINIYLREGHPFSEQEAIFLTSAASTLAGIIEHKQIEASLIESENNLTALFNATDDMVMMIEKDGTIVAVNNEIKNRFDTSPEAAAGKIIFELLPPDLRTQRMPHVKKVLETKRPCRFQDKYNGRYYDNSLFPIYDAGGNIKRIAVFSKDMTQLRTMEDELRTHTEEFKALADAFNTLSAVSAPENLHEAICSIAVRNFDIKMAWLGEPVKETFEVKPVALAGHEKGYLSHIKVTYDDSEHGNGPSGKAIKTRHPSTIDNIEDENFSPWKAEALKRGYSSSIALPLLDSDANVMAVLNAYSGKPAYFDRKKVHLLGLYANYAAIALENRLIIKRLEDKVSERTAELESFGGKLYKLYELSYAAGRNSKEFTKMILDELPGLLKVETAAVTTFDKDYARFMAVSEPNSQGLKEGMEVSKDRVLCGIVSDRKEPVVINDTLSTGEYGMHACTTDTGIRSYLGVPVFNGKKLMGCLCTFSRSPHTYTGYDVVLHQLLSKRLEFELVREKYENRLRGAMVKARTASQAKSEFLANMSHELRTPLNSIIGFSEMINDGMTGEINKKQEDFLTDIIGSAKHLLSLINDILDMSKVEAGKMELELSEQNLEDIANSCMSMFREKVLKNGISAAVSIEKNAETIIADERKLKQILFNLLSNAFKFTPAGGSVTLNARRNSRRIKGNAAPGDDPVFEGNTPCFEISVTDTGPGIPAKDRGRLFQPFEQLDTPYLNKQKGTGLGLALCKKLAELHGGGISVQSVPGRGSTFTVHIPCDLKPS